MPNVKEHATLSAGAHVDHGVDVEVTKDHVNRAADRGCVSRLVLPSSFSVDSISMAPSHVEDFIIMLIIECDDSKPPHPNFIAYQVVGIV